MLIVGKEMLTPVDLPYAHRLIFAGRGNIPAIRRPRQGINTFLVTTQRRCFTPAGDIPYFNSTICAATGDKVRVWRPGKSGHDKSGMDDTKDLFAAHHMPDIQGMVDAHRGNIEILGRTTHHHHHIRMTFVDVHRLAVLRVPDEHLIVFACRHDISARARPGDAMHAALMSLKDLE